MGWIQRMEEAAKHSGLIITGGAPETVQIPSESRWLQRRVFQKPIRNETVWSGIREKIGKVPAAKPSGQSG